MTLNATVAGRLLAVGLDPDDTERAHIDSTPLSVIRPAGAKVQQNLDSLGDPPK